VDVLREPGALYGRIARTYVNWAGTLLPLALVVFVPLGLVHAIPVHADLTSIDFRGGVEVLVLAGAVVVLAATGLIGEVFYTGAVSIALTHPHGGEPPSLREVARTVNYRRLIAVDLIYGVVVSVGLVALVIPGILAFVYLGLAAPVVEIERRGVREGLRRSVDLVRGHFWLVLAVFLPIELIGDALTDLATHLAAELSGDSLLLAWLADTASNVLLTPFYAVAAVLLTLELITDLEGAAPRLHSAPPRA
jgi:hypothetical protein